jgi:hypothetical protein
VSPQKRSYLKQARTRRKQFSLKNVLGSLFVQKPDQASRLRQRPIERLEVRQLLAAGVDPVVVIPGFGGTLAADESPAGMQHWYTNRGLAPTDLALEPTGQIYQNIIQSLENVGYSSDENDPQQSLFIVPWDWRLPVAPLDASNVANDGVLSGITTASITDSTFSTGLDYLGYVLQ